ncbi:MAG: response regulator [Lewinella sp.]|nr:response regulator [Lewinella sp.]
MASEKQGKILLVDDEPNILVALEFLVRQAGYEVQTAPDGNAALQTVDSFRPDIVVLDVMMPGMDGFEVAQRLRAEEQYNDLTIIFLTAKGTQQDRYRGYASGGEIYLSKPFDNDELVNTINEAFEFG